MILHILLTFYNIELHRLEDAKEIICLHNGRVCFYAFLRVHDLPSVFRVYPVRHAQWKDPAVFTQVCSQPPLFTAHSSISARRKVED